jgi:hypothetical protein
MFFFNDYKTSYDENDELSYMDQILPGVKNLLLEVERTMTSIEPTVASLKSTYNSVFPKADEIIELNAVDYQKAEISNKIAEKVIHELEVTRYCKCVE